MDKVKLTREQAEELEIQKRELKPKDIVQRRILTTYPNSVFTNIELDTLIKALYIGYEIKEEFKVGDWVKANWIVEKPTIHKLKGIDRNTVEIDGEQNNKNPGISIISLATPEEIAAEKERRWWAKHGRDVWELRKGDLLREESIRRFYNVRDVTDESICFSGDVFPVDKKELTNKFVVVCFAENRLDEKDE